MKMILENDNSELSGYFEAFLEDFQKIATDMLAAINVDRGATLKIPDAEYNRLKRVGEALDALAKRKFNFENTPDFKPVVDALSQVRTSLDAFKLPEKIECVIPEGERNIAVPEIDTKPFVESVRKLEQLFLSGIGVRITNFEEMPLVFEKASVGSSQSGMKLPEYDYVSIAYPNSTTEVYTFKFGGSSGDVVAITTVVYTNSSKDFISSVTKE